MNDTHPILSEASADFVNSMSRSPEFQQLHKELSDFASRQSPEWSPSKPISEAEHAYFSGVANGIGVILQLLSGK